MSSVFGGSKQKSSSSSYNKAYGDIKDWASPLLGYSTGAAGDLAKFFSGDASGFNNYKANTGFDWTSEQGSRGITNNAAAKSLLRSGSTGKSLVTYGNNLQQTYADNYLNKLLGFAGLGTQAAGALAGAGQVSNSEQSSKSKPGIGGFLGGAMSGIAGSDRRLKTEIKKIGTREDGLNIYTFRYIDNPKTKRIGVMADEVAKVKPEALGPIRNGYATVNYDLIWNA